MWVDAFPEQLGPVIGPLGLGRVKPSTPRAKTRLRRRSARRLAYLMSYQKARKAILDKKPGCPVSWRVFGIQRPATMMHHVRGRLGVLLADERYLMAVSFEGHCWIHDHPDEARKRGWLAQPGEWNKP